MIGATTTTTVVRAECCSSRRCWGDLPEDIIDSILGRLTLLADYDRFGAVCSSWRRTSLDPTNRDRHIEFSLSAALLLFLSDETLQPRVPWKCSLFNVVRGNTTTMVKEVTLPPIPGGSSRRFCGSSHGWLIFAEVFDLNLSLNLINPFYIGGGRGMIRLPNLVRRHSSINFVKVVLSADPALFPDDYFVCVICSSAYDNRTTQFIKSVERDWKLVRDKHNLRVDDVLFHNDIMYVLDQSRRIYICDITTTTNLSYFAHFPTTICDGRRSIVVSPSGEILLICGSNQFHPAATKRKRHFNVFELCRYPAAGELTTKGNTTWYETKNLGDKAIFLGRSHSSCINININKTTTCSGGNGLQPDSIYYTDNNIDIYLYGYVRKCPIEVGVFNMADGSIQKYSAKGVGIFTPLWFFPSLPGNWKHP